MAGALSGLWARSQKGNSELKAKRRLAGSVHVRAVAQLAGRARSAQNGRGRGRELVSVGVMSHFNFRLKRQSEFFEQVFQYIRRGLCVVYFYLICVDELILARYEVFEYQPYTIITTVHLGTDHLKPLPFHHCDTTF